MFHDIPVGNLERELNEELCEQINNHASNPHAFRPLIATTQIKFVEYMERVGGIMYHAEVSFNRPLLFTDLDHIKTFMHDICTNELTYEVHGLQWFVGDGDDSGACWLEGNTITIWVRSWGPDL